MRIGEYVANKQKRDTTTFVICGGEGYYIDGGNKISVKEFEAMYPLPDKVFIGHENKYHGENADTSKV